MTSEYPDPRRYSSRHTRSLSLPSPARPARPARPVRDAHSLKLRDGVTTHQWPEPDLPRRVSAMELTPRSRSAVLRDSKRDIKVHPPKGSHGYSASERERKKKEERTKGSTEGADAILTLSLASMSAPFASSASTITAFPETEAAMSGVRPSCGAGKHRGQRLPLPSS
jgi:hypothetical protein